jgi:predicted O-linked N-acetylglucosamine transferase (SPINDLY family)
MVTRGGQQVLAELMGQAIQQHRSGNLKSAKAGYTSILKLDSGNAEALHLLGCVYDDMGSTDQGIKMLLRAAKANPKAPSYFYNLANMELKRGSHQDAIRHYREAVRLMPDYAFAYNNLGRALTLVGQRDEAKGCFESAIRCGKVGYPDPHYNLGTELKADGDFDRAVAAFQEALRIQPGYADAHCNLGSAYLQMQRIAEAAESFQAAAKLQPGDAKFQTNVGTAMLLLGRQQEAIACFERALQLNPADAVTRSNLILATSYTTASGAPLYALSDAWDRIHAAPLLAAVRRNDNRPDSERRLRIGYVSADFRNHAAAYWIEPLLAGSQHVNVDVICYSNSPLSDEMTLRLKPYAATWVECAALSDEALAERIRRDAIDILVDLSSHTQGNRLLVFARQPAPVQVSWFGFPISTGLRTMQYRISDEIIDPPGMSDGFYSEKLVRLNRFYAAYRPDPNAPQVGTGPAARGNGATFVSLNTFAKITRPTLELWANILLDTPDSRLLLQSAGLEDAELSANVRDLFAQRGVAPNRLTLRGWTSINDFLRLGEEADIALDPFPFNGGVTNCHAVWMGLPVITQVGESAASRIGASILSRMGLQELVTSNPDAYRAAAVALAKDAGRLAALRASLRERMETAGILDGPDLAAQTEAAYRDIWRTWCANATQ